MLANSWESPFSDGWFYKSRTGDRKHVGDFSKKVQRLPAPRCWLLDSLCHSPGYNPNYKDLPASFPRPVPAKQACLILLPVEHIWNSFRSLRSTQKCQGPKEPQIQHHLPVSGLYVSMTPEVLSEGSWPVGLGTYCTETKAEVGHITCFHALVQRRCK